MIACLLLTSTCLTAPAAGLWFEASELPALRAWCEGEGAAQWQAVRTEADRLSDPAAPTFADPARVDAGGYERLTIRAHAWGRRLSNQLEPLGFAWQITGEPRYARTGIDVLLAAAEKLPTDREEIAKSFAGARGDIARGLALGLEWLGPAMSPDEHRIIAERAADYIRNILAEAGSGKAWWVPYHNYIGVAVGAVGCLALLLNDTYPAEAPGWIADCTTRTETWLNLGFDAQGAYAEGLGYSNYGLSNGVLFMEGLLRRGGPNLFAHPHLQQVPAWFALSLLPGERVGEDRNDSGLAGASEAMLLLSARLPSGLARWVWDETGNGPDVFKLLWHNDVAPVPPAEAGVPLSRWFEGRGLAIFRTGWSSEDLMFSLESGRYYPVTHDQRDKGHFNFYGLGGRWCVDSGYGNNREPEGRASSLAHSVVLVDGEQQAMAGAGAGTNGQILAFSDSARAGYVLADAAEAYRTNNHKVAGVPVERALRHAFFIRPADGLPGYAVVLDDIRLDDAPHTFTWQWHTGARNAVELTPDGAWARPVGLSGGAYVETPLDATGHGSVTIPVTTPTAGRWRLWAKVRASGPIASKADSFVVQVDGGPAVQWHMPSSLDWSWGVVGDGIGAEQKPLELDLPAGAHTVIFRTREPGAQVDCLALQPADVTTPPLDAVAIVEAESGDLVAPMQVVRPNEPAAAQLRLQLSAAAPLTFRRDFFLDHPRVQADATVADPRFAAVFTPLPADLAAPRLVRTQNATGEVLEIVWPQRTDTIDWPRDPEEKATLR